ncbi:MULTISPECIES: hypothetical protein [unclassified Frankia]|uniref:hypothetical protein n=1 Tax=unclassified Frankia TaxID=2632575 RepID=UPI002AD50D4E|nr:MULTISPECIES: hypothetical protein [unclassified Frankia]
MDVPTCLASGSISVDATDTVRAILDSVREADAPALATILRRAARPGSVDTATSVYVADAFTKIRRGDVGPRSVDGPDCLEETDTLRELEKLGYLEFDDLAYETSDDTYLDEGRALTALRVLRPFCVVTVVYRWTRGQLGPADQWDIVNHSGVVWPGTYVQGTVGDFRQRDVGVVYAGPLDGVDTDALRYAIREGSDVYTCHAVCDSCDSDWYAADGSWAFRRNTAAHDFDFDDARRITNGTIMCPEPLSLSGRVGFTVG